jgi:hypothetical protein
VISATIAGAGNSDQGASVLRLIAMRANIQQRQRADGEPASGRGKRLKSIVILGTPP